MGGFNDFAPFVKNPQCFIVHNIAFDKKTIKIFNYPILWNTSRDLLGIPGVSESDIRASLLKGEIKHKILAKEIYVICSDIDLLQFNDEQKKFLQDAGITNGLEVTTAPGNLNYAWRQEIDLIGVKNGTNRTFFTPEKFINGLYYGNNFHIDVSHNGKRLFEGIDYRVAESSGAGTGYDMIVFIAFTPISRSVLKSNYVVKT